MPGLLRGTDRPTDHIDNADESSDTVNVLEALVTAMRLTTWNMIGMRCYPVRSFFLTDSQERDFWSKLNNDKAVLIFQGSGNNGKFQMYKQLEMMSPPGRYILSSGRISREQISNISSGQKLICTENTEAAVVVTHEMTEDDYDVVIFPRVFN